MKTNPFNVFSMAVRRLITSRPAQAILLPAMVMAGTSYTYAQQWPEAKPEARPGVRWWWPGSAVDKQDLHWNLSQFSQCGIGAIEITPIYGVQGNEGHDIEFLSDKWMDMLRFTQQECLKHNIETDMATGTGWPFGGPWVPLDESCSRIEFENDTITKKQYKKTVKEQTADKDTKTKFIGRYFFPIDKKHWRVITAWQKLGVMKVKRPAPGGEGYVIDHFDKQSVLHYLQHIEQAFDRTHTSYPHTFFNDSYEVSNADYTPRLFSEFKQRRGYSLEANMDKLVDGDQKVVADYRETLGDLLLDNFTKVWTSWAHEHGAITRNQAHGSPANLIDCYGAVDIPEIEGFGLTDFNIRGLRKDSGFTRKNDSDFSMYKWASSAAHITGKPFTSSETFTWLTEHFRTSLSQMKPDMDLMFCGGVNHMFFHGACYSPEKAAWPGWHFYATVDMSPTNSIWRDAPYLMHYITRCQQFLQWGKPDNDFLVYVPVRDAWNSESKGKRLMQFSITTVGKLSPSFVKVINTIDQLGYDCDYISESYILSTHFVDGMLQTAGGTRYKALVIPESNNMMTEEVRQHILALQSQGAQIIIGANPQKLRLAAQPEQMKSSLGLRAIRRSNPYGYHYFITNLTPRDIDAKVKLAKPFKDALWFDPMNGNRYAATYNNDSILIRLKSGESMILETFADNGHLTPATDGCTINGQHISFRHDRPYDGMAMVIKGKWKLSFANCTPHYPNTLTLDNVQPWETLNDTLKTLMGTGIYERKLNITPRMLKHGNNWAIDLGDVRESARVYINDSLIGCAWAAPFTLHFSKLFKPGTNKLRIEVTNLPANRISELDRQNYNWRIMKDINIVNIHYKKTSYANWAPMPSGLNSNILIYKTK